MKKNNAKNMIRTAAFCLLFLVGLSLLFYPLISSRWNKRRSDSLVRDYVNSVAAAPAEDYSGWFAAAERYNASLEGKSVPDAFAAVSEEENADYLSQLAFRSDGIMAYLRIPKIDVDLPIYHGTSADVLEKGVGHLIGSALPVGGEGNHTVLSAHRGLPSATLFTDLDRLSEGDHFYIHVLDRTLAYEVDQILTVEPTELDALRREPGMDLATLVTCTPYGVNSHRLLVRGHRVEYVEAIADREAAEVVQSPHTRYGLWAAGGLLATLLFTLLLMFLRTLHRRARHERGRHLHDTK